jgi:hypothetical protein
MAKKKHKKASGHYCWVCGERKPNEKFSGSGHANHICRKCQKIPVEERNKIAAVRRAGNMAFRHLSKQDIKWLRNSMDDPRPEVREAARSAHNFKFPHYERNLIKKGLTARSLEFYIHGDVWSEFGDEIPVRMRFFADNSGSLRRIDYNAPDGEQETVIDIGQPAALKFLKAVVHQLNAPFWSEDLSDAEPDEYGPYDPNLDTISEFPPDFNEDDYFYFDDEDEENEPEAPAEDRVPIWSLRLLLTKGIGEQTQIFYNQMHHEPQELFWYLMDWFEPNKIELE